MSFLEDLVESDTPVEEYLNKIIEYIPILADQFEAVKCRCDKMVDEFYIAVREGKTYADCRNKMLEFVVLKNKADILYEERNLIYEAVSDIDNAKQKIQEHIKQMNAYRLDPEKDKQKINITAVSNFYFIQDDARLTDCLRRYYAKQEAEKEASNVK